MLHWPGGWRAESYHWRDGIGNSEQRARTVTYQTGAIDDNGFGTHEFFDLCEQLGAEPYLVTNVGSGTVQEAADWVERYQRIWAERYGQLDAYLIELQEKEKDRERNS